MHKIVTVEKFLYCTENLKLQRMFFFLNDYLIWALCSNRVARRGGFNANDCVRIVANQERGDVIGVRKFLICLYWSFLWIFKKKIIIIIAKSKSYDAWEVTF